MVINTIDNNLTRLTLEINSFEDQVIYSDANDVRYTVHKIHSANTVGIQLSD